MAHLILKMCNASDPPVSCKLVLKQPDRHVFTTGDTVEGTLIVSHQKDLILHGFKVVLEGTAFTKYKEGETIQNKTDTFLSNHQYVFPKDTQAVAQQRVRHAGSATPRKYTFKIQFPEENVPATFKSPYGMVHYQIVTYMHMPNERFVKKAEKPILVNSTLILKDASVLSPVICEKSDKSMGSRRGARQFKFRMSLPQSGYLAGEEIPFEFELDNPNELEISNICIALVQKTTYRAGNWSRILKTTSTEIVTAEKNVMDTNYGTIWADALKIPGKQISTQPKGLIEIQYVLKAEVNLKSGGAGLRKEIPIVIGTARLGDNSSGRYGQEQQIPIPASTSRGAYRQCVEDSNIQYGSPSSLGMGRPPSYSTLSLRSITRSSSWETLPPDYEDVATGLLDEEKAKSCPDTPDYPPPPIDIELLSISDRQ